VRIEIVKLDHYVRQISSIVNRLAFAIVVAAILVASAVSLQNPDGPSLFDVPIIAVVGFVVSMFLGFWLLIAILRSGSL